MARPTKKGLDYFPFDVGFFGDNGIKILKARYRSDGIAVYVKILCDVYKEGYFLPVECWEDYVFVIADEIGATFDKVEQIITFLQSRAMVRIFRKGKDELTGIDVDAVITSHGIQKRYAAAMKSHRKKDVDDIKRGFWLLSEEEENEINAFYKSAKNGGFSENNPSFSENIPRKSEKNPTKEKKIKECTDVPREKADFFQRFPLLKESAAGVDDSRIDYAKLTECFLKSKKHLQTRRVFSWVVEHYDAILSGKYDDFAEAQAEKPAPALPPDVQAANARAAREKFYANRKNAAEIQAQKMLQLANANAPQFKAISQQLAKLTIPMAKAELYDQAQFKELKAVEKKLLKARADALAKIGMSESDLLPKYHCQKCSDTGFLPSGAACDCYKA